jgi:hypothetical protein
MKNQPDQIKISRSAVARVVEATVAQGARKATLYLSPILIVRATRQFRNRGRRLRDTVVLTVGRPNYAERHFVKTCQKAGEPFPVRKVQLTWYPVKRARR